MQTEAGDFGNFSHMYQCITIQQRYPKGEGKEVFPRPEKLYSSEPKARRPFVHLFSCFCHQSVWDISTDIFTRINLTSILYIIYHFLCAEFVNLHPKRTSF